MGCKRRTRAAGQRSEVPPRPADAAALIYASPGGWSWLTEGRLRNPFSQEYPLHEEPTPRDLLLPQRPGLAPQPRLPERRFRDLETMLRLPTPCAGFRDRLYEIVDTVVSADERINPRQQKAAASNHARDERLARRFAAIEKTARTLAGLLTDDDPWEQRGIDHGVDVFAYPREPEAKPMLAFADALIAIADAAQRSAQSRRRRRGRGDYFCAWLVRNLADLYSKTTNKRPARSTDPWDGKPGGPFFRFVRYVYNWIGSPYAQKSDDAVAGDIRRYAPCSCSPLARQLRGGCACARRWDPWVLAALKADMDSHRPATHSIVSI